MVVLFSGVVSQYAIVRCSYPDFTFAIDANAVDSFPFYQRVFESTDSECFFVHYYNALECANPQLMPSIDGIVTGKQIGRAHV